MAFQSLKNFTRTLTSLVNRNQRKLRVVSITTNEMELDPRHLPQKGTPKNPIKMHIAVNWVIR